MKHTSTLAYSLSAFCLLMSLLYLQKYEGPFLMIKVRGILILNDTSGISALDFFFWISVEGTRPNTWYLLCAVSRLAPHWVMSPR